MTAYANFTAWGIPQPKGSSRWVPTKRGVRVTSDNPKLKAWQTEIAKSAKAVYPRLQFTGPIAVTVQFEMPHPTTGKRRQFHTTRPDVDKLLRAVNDALTGILWNDDAAVVELEGRKVYADVGCRPCVRVVITEIDR